MAHFFKLKVEKMFHVFITTEFWYLNFHWLLNLNALITESFVLNGFLLLIHLEKFGSLLLFLLLSETVESFEEEG